MVVDAHTHLLPGRLAEKIRAFFDEHVAGDLAYEIDINSTLDALHYEGVETVWNLPYAHRADVASQLNRDILGLSEAFADHPVDIVPGCTVHPDDSTPARDLSEAVEAGARVLKLHCSVGNYSPVDPRLHDVLSEAATLGVPVVIHAGHAISGSTMAEELGPVGQAAAAHPDTTLILAHFGHHAFEDAAQLMTRHPNLYADLTPVVVDPVPLTIEVAERFRERILFGSDAPNTGRPVTELLAGLTELGLEPATYRRITRDNAIGLISG